MPAWLGRRRKVLKGATSHSFEGVGCGKWLQLGGWNGTRVDPLLPERARSECARSTAAGGSTRVPFHERVLEGIMGIIE
ncbi:MAG: hypothetical protein RL042_891 [Nitrospirota bacterium]|jgi:hypothetical protein